MAHLQGRWVIASVENMEEFLSTCGADETIRQKAREGLINPTQEITVKGEEFTIKTSLGHLSTDVTFKLGVKFPSSSMDGKRNMTIFTMEGDSLVETQVYDTFTSTVTRQMSGDQLVATLQVNDVKAVVKYTRA